MKRILSLALALVLALALGACAQSPASTSAGRVTVKIGITGEAENVIWAPVKTALAADGIDLEIINFADYTLLNGALKDGDIDLNAFQHYAYLNQQIADNGYEIAAIGDTYISAMSIYSDKLTDVNGLKDGDKIAIPNDPVNLGRALSVAQGAGIITLGEPAESTYELENITGNPKNIEFVTVDAAQIPSLLPDVAAGIINGNYALDFGLSPQNDAIFYDDVSFYPDNRYVNTITSRSADVSNATYLKIVAAYQSDAVEQVFKNDFDGSYLPGWKK
ncbi:MAG: MetQ/NlpA family ABC transporter substrate-binding protein [Oscillospiraceae bacterium]|jgi:D-methionine transport system substrate-binding protein|nr:MetQ/NlpA family ABC transporter substrate-binding protein [Oscillospiraceae bacterium]